MSQKGRERNVRPVRSSVGLNGAESLRAALYVRVSTSEQDPGMQVETLTAEASRRGWSIVDVYADRGISGAKDRRPALDRLMADIRAGTVEAVLVWKFDRFARSVKHLLSALDEFQERGVAFVSITENIDTTTALGRALFTIVAAVAELERELARERVQAGVRRARRRRATWGRPRKWTDEQLARARELRASGKSWRTCAMAVGLKVRTLRRALERRGENQSAS